MGNTTHTLAPASFRQSPVLAWFKNQAEEMDAGVLVPALLFTTGTITDAAGDENTYEKKDLDRIARATKRYYKNGGNVHLFDSNHDLDAPYSVKDIIGRLAVDEGLTVEEITAENLPDDRLVDLVGQYGIYGYLMVTRDDAVERYNATLLKPISIAFDRSGKFTDGNKWAIFEVSAVPWGAVRGAMLFGRFPVSDFVEEQVITTRSDRGDEVLTSTLLVGAEPGRPKIFALTLEGAIAEKEGRWKDGYSDLEEGLNSLFWMVTDVFYSIRNTTDEELQGRDRNTLLRDAISDLEDKLQEMLGVRRDAPPAVSVNSKGDHMADDNKTALGAVETPEADDKLAVLMADVEALKMANAALTERADKADERADNAEKFAAQLQHERTVSDRVTRLKAWGQKLLQVGKLTPAAFKEWFPEDEQHGAAVVRFSKPAGEDTPGGESVLTEIEAALKYTDKHVDPVRFGSRIGEQEIGGSPYRSEPEPTEAEKAQIDDVAKTAASNRYY